MKTFKVYLQNKNFKVKAEIYTISNDRIEFFVTEGNGMRRVAFFSKNYVIAVTGK
jgi:hypothetical protein